jgi:hypothetical protein
MSSNDNDGKIDTQRTRIVNNNGCIFCQTPAGPKHLLKLDKALHRQEMASK